MKAGWAAVNSPCGICGQPTIDWDGARNLPDSFELDHRQSIRFRPDLEFDRENVQPSHHRCNRSKGSSDSVLSIGQTSESW